MRLLRDLRAYQRFALGLPGFLRRRLTPERALAIVRQRLAQREENFLRLAEKGIFGHARSPYRQLLRWAGCEPGDLRALVRAEGLEGALLRLRQDGVYVSYEEFKGGAPIVRGSLSLAAPAEAFDNPWLARCYEVGSSGSTGAGTRVLMDLDHLADRAPQLLLADQAHGLLGRPKAVWMEVPPGPGLNLLLPRALYGDVPRRWFTPVTGRDLRPLPLHAAGTWASVAIARLMGAPLPWPERVPLAEARVVARWAAETARAEGGCAVMTYVSRAVRTALAALEEGLDLSGTIFSMGAEPPTPAKVEQVRRSGARVRTHYFLAEAGPVGMSCTRSDDPNEQHLLSDHLALVQYPREVRDGVRVDAFHLTTLLPTAPKIMLNVEGDDFGVVEARDCGCPLQAAGYATHLREIRSFRKLTGEGMTLLGSEMLRILDHALPARFGGSPLDYQLVEEEDEHGLTRVTIAISPRLGPLDERAVIAAVLHELGRGRPSVDLARAVWAQADTLRVRRIEPVWTAGGKLNPLHMAEGRHAAREEVGSR